MRVSRRSVVVGGLGIVASSTVATVAIIPSLGADESRPEVEVETKWWPEKVPWYVDGLYSYTYERTPDRNFDGFAEMQVVLKEGHEVTRVALMSEGEFITSKQTNAGSGSVAVWTPVDIGSTRPLTLRASDGTTELDPLPFVLKTSLGSDSEVRAR